MTDDPRSGEAGARPSHTLPAQGLARGRNGGEPGKGHDGSHRALQILDRHVHPFMIDLM